MNTEFNNNDSFRNFVYENICQCFNQCIDLDEKTFNHNQPVCSQIVYQEYNTSQDNTSQDNTSQDNFSKIINNALKYFIKNDIIFKNGVRYYLSEDNTKLSWDNIKNLNNEVNKKLLWLLRKLIVDCILKSLLKPESKLKIFSVGSTNLTSDYDITLYGNDIEKINIIDGFNIKFNDLFSDTSALVFDTNIYGKAYIAFSENDFGEYGSVVNNQQSFYYLKSGNENSQLSWALVKYITDLRDSFGEHIYNDLIDFMKDKLDTNLLNYATEIRRNLKNKDEDFTYKNILGVQNKILDFYQDKLTGYNDYISLVNFFGIETYFTRGAFLDIVVNGQMCNNTCVDLTEVDLICSILENAGFFFNHNNKTKYFVRVSKTLGKLVLKNNLYKEIHEIEELYKIVDTLKSTVDDKINYDKLYCKWIDIDNDTFDLNKCEKYPIFNLLFKIIYKILKIYIKNNEINDKDFIFYNIFIKNNNEKTNSISPSTEFIKNNNIEFRNRNRSLSEAISPKKIK
jgi:hypothetical protein